MKWKSFTCFFYKNNEEVYKDTFENKLNSDRKIVFDMLDYETTINIEEKTFLRENKEYIFYLDLNNKSCKVELKQEGISFEVSVEEANIEVENGKIILEYFIETDETRNKIVLKERMDFHE